MRDGKLRIFAIFADIMMEGNYNHNIPVFTDTGMWRLVLSVSDDGIIALLRNITVPASEGTHILFRKEWECKNEELLSNIEGAVYDNPRILEDFATHIVVTTAKALWIPSELVDEDEVDDKYFNCVFPCDIEDISLDIGENESCAYTLTPGLNSFLRRTLPGCKVTSHLSIIKSEFEKAKSRSDYEEKENRIYVNIRKDHADIFAFSSGRFLCGAVHEWKEITDIVYKTLLISDAYGLDPKETAVKLFCPGRIQKFDFKKAFDDFFPDLYLMEMPDLMENENVPFASALVATE